MHRIRAVVLLLSLGTTAAGCRPARVDPEGAARRAVIEGVLARIQASYVVPAVATRMSHDVRARLARGEYAGLPLGQGLADSLTAHLRAVSHDKHLEVVFRSGPLEASQPGADRPDEMRRRLADELREINYGIESVEILEGDIGYLDLHAFVPVDVPGASDAVAEAMDSLSDTDALIIDLRRNRGGEPDMVQLVASYLFGPDPVQLSSIYWRPTNLTQEFWTLRDLRGPRYGPERPVYVLTSSATFSAAEALAYDLKSLKRATVVGETTRGGAHPAVFEAVSSRFGVVVPQGRAINPVTGTNWERTGVEPDIVVGPDAPLQTAHLAALRRVLSMTTGAKRRAELEALIR
jgi:hypothetical protein